MARSLVEGPGDRTGASLQSRPVSRPARAPIVALVAYVALSFLFFGVHLLPHPGRVMLGSGRDPEIFVWSFAWWQHALGAGGNPFVSHAVYAPDGINLAWATSVPGLAVPFAPLTNVAGPVASYNVAMLLLPALSAWTAFLLCRYLTGRFWPSFAGGYLFGFSAYVVAQTLGHPHMSAVFLLPLVALVLVRYVRRDLTARGSAWRLGLLLGWQLWLSTELYTTLAVALAVSLALAYLCLSEHRPRLRTALSPLAAAYGLSLLLAAPLVYYALSGFRSESINEPAKFSADLANLVVPTHILALTTSGLTSISRHFPGNDAEQGAYLGLPTLAIVVWFAIRGRASAATRYLVVLLALSVFVSLGTALRVEGDRKLWLPWSLVAGLPVFDNVLPVRFAAYTALAAAVIVALWTASTKGWAAIVLPALAIAVLLPAVWRPDFRSIPQRWPFFTDGAYKLCIPKGENVVVFPYGFRGDSMLWQAESGFWFRMAEGYLTPKPPEPFIDDPLVQKLTYTYELAGPAQILGFARRKHVGRVLSTEIDQHPSGLVMHRFGPLQVLGGIMVAPACGHEPLTRQG
jgi:hypothetical protein